MTEIVRQYFKGTSIDLQKCHADAQYWADRGEASVVHDHNYTQPCTDICKTYEPGKVDDDGHKVSEGQDRSNSS